MQRTERNNNERASAACGVARLAVAIDGADEAGHHEAAALAQRLRLPLLASIERGASAVDLVLVRTALRLELRESSVGRARPVFVDFIGGATGFRRRSCLSGTQPIAKAVGIRSGTETVLDATAGLARDAFLLACLGCRVVAVERNPILAALIEDGLRRAKRDGTPPLGRIIERITLICADARDVLRETASVDAPDAVYVDPMYPTTRKTALVKKEMRLCRVLVGDDPDAADLLDASRGAVRRRVAVKRRRFAPPLGPEPDIRYLSKQLRYDVYLAPTTVDE